MRWWACCAAIGLSVLAMSPAVVAGAEPAERASSAIRGTVIVGGAPLAGVQVTAVSGGLDRRKTTTDARFEQTGFSLPPGQYQFVFEPFDYVSFEPEWYADAAVQANARTVTIDADYTTTIQMDVTA